MANYNTLRELYEASEAPKYNNRQKKGRQLSYRIDLCRILCYYLRYQALAQEEENGKGNRICDNWNIAAACSSNSGSSRHSSCAVIVSAGLGAH